MIYLPASHPPTHDDYSFKRHAKQPNGLFSRSVACGVGPFLI